MSAPLHYVRIHYKNHEEVLETGVWYFRNAAGATVNTMDVRDFAQFFVDNFANATLIFGAGVILYGVEVNVPEQSNGAGPFTYMVNLRQEVTLGVDAYGDYYTYNIAISGADGGGKVVTGGMRLAGVKGDTVDCNVLEDATVALVEQGLNAIFPPTVGLSGGQTYVRVVRSKVGTPEEDVVSAPTLACSTRIGIRSDRVLNRFARAKVPAGDPGDPT